MGVARPILAVLERELLRLARQRGRLLSAMVRPLLWLTVIGSGFAAMQGKQGGSGYQSFLVPGVLGLALLFGGVLAALSTVNDRESGVMRMLIVAPIEHYWIVIAKTLGAMLTAVVQALLLLVVLGLFGYLSPQVSLPLLAAGLLATALACASLGMLIAAWSRTLDNYATMMNFVIFPVFFLSGSLYPVQQLPAVLRVIATLNPYTHGVDVLKHAAVTGPAAGFSADFAIGTDFAVLAAFSAVALAIASLRFSREAANEPLVHRLARKHGD
ncbi:MAG TPA: ABC transporter permease [Steroidobacteraceae bacterium]